MSAVEFGTRQMGMSSFLKRIKMCIREQGFTMWPIFNVLRPQQNLTLRILKVHFLTSWSALNYTQTNLHRWIGQSIGYVIYVYTYI